MSILIDENTRVVVQGLSGYQARFDTEGSLTYGTKVVAGVVPGRKGETVLGIPIFDTVAKAIRETGATTSVIYVPAHSAKDAIIEAAHAGIELVVVITERVPMRDFAAAFEIARNRGTRLVGPNCNGIISPGKTKLGILGNAPRYFMPGPVGCLSRSGGMNHEIPNLLTRAGIGQSTCISIGGDPMVGTTFREGVELFEKDDATQVIVLFCEPGGRMEEEVADLIKAGEVTKPAVAYVSGSFVEDMPEGMPFGHAGAMIERGVGRPSEKKRALTDAGVHVVKRLRDIPNVVNRLLAEGNYFPPVDGEWSTITPTEAGWDPQRLDQALEFAREARSTGVVILVGGRILAERYWELSQSDLASEGFSGRPGAEAEGVVKHHHLCAGTDCRGHPIEDVASVQKSILSFLAGVAASKGLLDLDAPVAAYLGAGWSNAPREAEAAIRVRHMLAMASGLDEKLEYWAPAGEVWYYSTAAYACIVPILEAASGLDVHTYTQRWVTGPAGMNDTRWERRAWQRQVTWANPYGFYTTARDLARFGHLVLRRGIWDGQDVLENPVYLKEALSSSQENNPSYGYLWWLNGKKRHMLPGAPPRELDGKLVPSAPDDLVMAWGYFGRKLVVVPSLDLVVSRLGDEPGEGFDLHFWERLTAACPAGETVGQRAADDRL